MVWLCGGRLVTKPDHIELASRKHSNSSLLVTSNSSNIIIMADKIQIKAALASVGSLAINVRDQLAESYDQITYTNLCDNFKQ